MIIGQVQAQSYDKWSYTFNKLDLIVIPMASTISYLGYKNYTTTVNYDATDIASVQSSKDIAFDFYSPPMEQFSHYLSIGIAGAGWVSSISLVDMKPKKWFTLGVMYTEMMMIERGIIGITKNVSRKARPYVYDPTVPMSIKLERGKDAFMSFPSGHASFAFANAFFWNDILLHSDWSAKWKIYGTGFLYGSASLVSIFRVTSGEHFLVDVLAGGGIGAITAYMSLKLHDIYDMEPYLDGNLSIVPTGRGVNMVYSF